MSRTQAFAGIKYCYWRWNPSLLIVQNRHHLSWLPEAAFGASGEEKAPSEATSPHPKVDIRKASSGWVAHSNMPTLSISMFNQVNPTYSVSVLKQKLTNQRSQGKSGIAWVNGAGAAASMSADLQIQSKHTTRSLGRVSGVTGSGEMDLLKVTSKASLDQTSPLKEGLLSKEIIISLVLIRRWCWLAAYRAAAAAMRVPEFLAETSKTSDF